MMAEKNCENVVNFFDLDTSIFNAISQLRRNKKRPDKSNIYNSIKKSDIFKQLTVETLEERLLSLIHEGKVINKMYGNFNSFYLPESVIEIDNSDVLYDEKSNVAYDDNNVENSERLTENNLEREIDSAMNFEGYADYLNNINGHKHLNGSKIHLNQDGSGILAKNLINALKFLEN